MSENDTISAIVTPIGTGGIAVIRASGPDAIAIADRLFRGSSTLSQTAGGTVRFGSIVDRDDRPVDEVIATVFRAPHSYTAEDVVEISCHGSVYIARRIAELLAAEGARPAGPGEFTRRAFLNGRMDLAQAEAVADLIQADSRSSQELALAQLRGALSTRVNDLRRRLVDACSLLELELDFSEEGVELVEKEKLAALLEEIRDGIAQMVDSYEHGKIARQGARVVLAGAPNVGKSSILNALIQEERAIVTPISGTTRDSIEESVTIAGAKLTIVDTAGLRITDDAVEVEGIRRTRQQLQFADLILFVIDPVQEIEPQVDLKILDRLSADPHSLGVVVVINKCDLSDTETVETIRSRFQPLQSVPISALTGNGIPELENLISRKVFRNGGSSMGESLLVHTIRQKNSLEKAGEAVNGAVQGLSSGISSDLLAVDLRKALLHLSEVSGAEISEEVLNNVFSRFCIGK